LGGFGLESVGFGSAVSLIFDGFWMELAGR
jgi:hypothetical protein